MTSQELRLPPHRNPVPTPTRWRTWRLPVLLYVAPLLLVPVLVIGAAMAQGWWSTSGRSGSTAAVKAGAGGRAAGQEASSSRDAGALPATTADVKGWMTVQQVSDAFPEVTVPALLDRLGAPPDTVVGTPLKDLLEPAGMDVPTLRQWLDSLVGE